LRMRLVGLPGDGGRRAGLGTAGPDPHRFGTRFDTGR
jgi:hypothetical protein